MEGHSISADRAFTKVTLENERRDVKDLWNQAIGAYKDILGEDLGPACADMAAIIQFGCNELNAFHSWRHKETKTDKLRRLFMSNIRSIEVGTQQIIAAATPAFPPAAAIGTALTFVLSACKSVSADYDIICAFFEDMNSFLERVTILESRLPRYRAYQVCLTEVFSSLLRMCALTTKTVRLGRFKKWVINSFAGQDEDLASSRRGMDKSLSKLQSATEFAILANTEGLLTSQEQLQRLQQELKKNQDDQITMAANQGKMVEQVLNSQANVEDKLIEIKSMLALMQEQKAERTETGQTSDHSFSSMNSVRNIVPEIPANDEQLQLLNNSRLSNTGDWILKDPRWLAWYGNTARVSPSPLLVITGAPGVGKSHVAQVICDHLRHSFEQDPGKFTLFSYFFCRNSMAGLNSFQSIVNTIVLQICKQSPALLRRISHEFGKDKKKLEEVDYFEKLITPLFGRTSKFRLYIVIDAINELRTSHDMEQLVDTVSNIAKLGLKIQIIATTRTNMNLGGLGGSEEGIMNYSELPMTKLEITSDIKTLTSDRLQNKNSTYSGLIMLHQYVKDRILLRVAEHAESLLYAEQLLRYLGGIGREGAIMRTLEESMPVDSTSLFEKMLRVCERRTPQDLLPAIRSLILWMTVCFDSLDLFQANELIRLVTAKNDVSIEDEITDIFNRFIYISRVLKEAGTSSSIAKSAEERHSFHRIGRFDDGDLLVAFREGIMRDFFSITAEDSSDSKLRACESIAHREVFLICCKIVISVISEVAQSTSALSKQKLCDYAVRYCLQHWKSIKLHEGTVEDNGALYEAFFILFSENKCFARLIEERNPICNIDQLLQGHSYLSAEMWDRSFFSKWQEWSQWLCETSINHRAHKLATYLSPRALEYWSGSSQDALLPLARGHFVNSFGSTEPAAIRKAYSCARRCLKKTRRADLLAPEIPDTYNDHLQELEEEGNWQDGWTGDGHAYEEEVFRLRTFFSITLGSNTHHATAVLCLAANQGPSAIAEIDKAIEQCEDSVQKSRYCVYRAIIYNFGKFPGIPAETTRGLALDCISAISQENLDNSAASIAFALFLKAYILSSDSETYGAALSIYKDMREKGMTRTTWGHNIYNSELMILVQLQDIEGITDLFVKLKPVERFAWVISQLRDQKNPHDTLLPAAQLSKRVIELAKAYSEISDGFGTDITSVVWRSYTARLHLMSNNIDAAAAELNRALDTTCPGQENTLTIVDAAQVVGDLFNMATDVLYQRFANSKSLAQKRTILEEVKGIPMRQLPLSVQTKNTSTIPHLIVTARMSRKVGLLEDFQTTLQQAFDLCWENLHDDFAGNDAVTLRLMSKVIGQFSSLYRDAQILTSAQLYYIGSLSELDCYKNGTGRENASAYGFTDIDGYTTYRNLFYQGEAIGHQWQTNSPSCVGCLGGWDTWNKLGEDYQVLDEFKDMYVCLCCTQTLLCTECYQKRIDLNKKDVPEDTMQPNFCCSSGQYIRGPVEGWKGIKDTMIEMEGQSPVNFQNYLKQLRTRWDNVWDDLWRGW